MIASPNMKQYVIDEIRPEDYKQIKSYLDEKFGVAELGGIYWMPVAEALLTPIQASHSACQPFFVALDLTLDRLCCELLIRTRQRVRCDCMGYATQIQRNWIIETVDSFLVELGIIT